jgi:hypothetical protein
MSAQDLDFPPLPPGGDDGGTNIWQGGGTTFNGRTPSTNDLWLQILSVSLSNSAANLVIHPPWNVANGVYELLYCTNLSPPISWQWLLRTTPGQTNLTVFNASDPQGFYRLEVPTDSTGTDFWLAFPNLLPLSWSTNLWLYVSSPLATAGTVTIPGFGITNAFSVAAGMVTSISIDPSVMIADYDVVETYGIHLTASQPVSVVAMKYDLYVSASFNCLPVTFAGTNYCVMARPTLIDGVGRSQFAIVATADNTTVSITPSPNANLFNHTNSYQTNLMQGQTYQIGTTNGDSTSDVTGTWIASDKPVVLLAGASVAYVPDSTQAANPLVQEQLPLDTWGEQALALSFAGKTGGDSYRVLAAADDTVVFTNGVVAGTTNAGEYLDFILDGPVEFRANHPIQVAQFAKGGDFDYAEGDPCEILLPPTGRYLQTNIVFTLPPYGYNTTGDFDQNYLNIIVPQSALTNTLVDGSTVDATNFVPIGTSGYYGAQIPRTNDLYEATTHTVTSSQPVGVEVYGFGEYDAYGYFGGIVR